MLRPYRSASGGATESGKEAENVRALEAAARPLFLYVAAQSPQPPIAAFVLSVRLFIGVLKWRRYGAAPALERLLKLHDAALRSSRPPVRCCRWGRAAGLRGVVLRFGGSERGTRAALRRLSAAAGSGSATSSALPSAGDLAPVPPQTRTKPLRHLPASSERRHPAALSPLLSAASSRPQPRNPAATGVGALVIWYWLLLCLLHGGQERLPPL